jgi:hypothetical protein
MSWVGVRYRKIALPAIMKTMRMWLDQRQFQPRTFDYVISRFGTLVRVEFADGSEAAEFAEAFGGELSRDRPSISTINRGHGRKRDRKVCISWIVIRLAGRDLHFQRRIRRS